MTAGPIERLQNEPVEKPWEEKVRRFAFPAAPRSSAIVARVEQLTHGTKPIHSNLTVYSIETSILSMWELYPIDLRLSMQQAHPLRPDVLSDGTQHPINVRLTPPRLEPTHALQDKPIYLNPTSYQMESSTYLLST
jgi:hypothetical protein